MKKKLFATLIGLSAVLALAACSDTSKKATTASSAPTTSQSAEVAGKTVEITDAHGTVNVPVNPQKVVALDSRTFETLAAWNVKLAAAPKKVMPADSPYVKDDSVQDIGNHREPNLEVLAAAEPDLVIVGQRFGSYYDEIKKLVPNAVVIDLNFDLSEKAEKPGENLVNGLKETTTSLGKIFEKTAEADALNAALDQKIADAKAAYNGTDTIMTIVVSGGDINFAAPHSGRLWGPLYDVLGWKPALEVDKTTSDHQGDDISVEAIAQSNPTWLVVLDRDAAIARSESKPAADVIEGAPALQNTAAIKDKRVYYAPNDTYTNESIETYIEIFEGIAKAFAQ